MNSLPTIEQVNLEKYWDVVRKLDPELFMVKVALQETGVNPVLLPKVIRAINNICLGGGNGKIELYVQRYMVTAIDANEKSRVNLEARKEM